MIIHTGLRTDIPAFYTPWLLNRLREGYVMVRSPYAPGTVTKYCLRPDVVDLLVFCTKNPRPLLSHMDALADYGQCWFVTITPYGRDVEPNVPPKEQVLEDFRKLSRIVGKHAVTWRYDPIFISREYPLERHLVDFAAMAEALAGHTDTCVISFIDLYKKVQRNFPEVRAVTMEEQIALSRELVQIGNRFGMTIKACAEGEHLKPYGVDCSGCMTAEVFEKALGQPLQMPKAKPGRSGCTCYLGCDIGQYDTCGHLCRYCYANSDPERARENLRRHDPKSPLLLGDLRPGDRIQEARQESWRSSQMSLFLSK